MKKVVVTVLMGIGLALVGQNASANVGILAYNAAPLADFGLIANAEKMSTSLDAAKGGAPIYDQLLALYNASTSTLPTQEELTGWCSGRCYRRTDKNKAEPALLAGGLVTTVEGDPHNGPLFPPTSTQAFHFVFIDTAQSDPAIFDNLSESMRAEADAVIPGELKKVQPAKIQDGAWLGVYEQGALNFRVRKSNQYFIGMADLTRDREDYKAGDVFVMCYYFKKVK